MMDLSLDHKQAKVYDCSSCDPQKMVIRNCQNKWGKSKSPLLVNGQVYTECPKALVVDDWEVGYLVSLYFDCKENKTTPTGGSLLNMTAFWKEAVEVMDAKTHDHQERQQKKAEEERKREMAKMKQQTKSKKR